MLINPLIFFFTFVWFVNELIINDFTLKRWIYTGQRPQTRTPAHEHMNIPLSILHSLPFSSMVSLTCFYPAAQYVPLALLWSSCSVWMSFKWGWTAARDTFKSLFSLCFCPVCVCVCVCVSLSLSRPLYIYKWIYSIHIYIYLNSASRSCWQCTSSLWHWVWLTVILCTE